MNAEQGKETQNGKKKNKKTVENVAADKEENEAATNDTKTARFEDKRR